MRHTFQGLLPPPSVLRRHRQAIQNRVDVYKRQGLPRRDGSTEIIKPLRRLPPDAPSAVIEYPANKAGTIKGCGRAGTCLLYTSRCV